MPLISTRVVKTSIVADIQSATIIHEERSFQGVWSKPNVPLLIFADHQLPASSASFHGGPIGTGLPVQLIFWGSWWNSANGVGQQGLIIERTKALIASDYFSELAQYGIARPTWRGALVVTKPSPPGAFNSNEDEKAVPDLIDDLIDDDVFPDPDDGRIAFVVLMPQGFTQSIGANGAHTYDFDYDFPFDEDNFWVAWVRFFDPATGEDPEDTIRTLSHELVELFTDPEPPTGWYAEPAEKGEISDAGVSGTTKQTAWVNGAHVQSYWSNRHSATVIPIDRDYEAQIRGVTSEESRRVLETGTFRPDLSDSAACEKVPACCMEDRDYAWTLVGFDELATLRLHTNRYRQPKAVWTIEGFPVTGTGSLPLNLLVGGFTGRAAAMRRTIVTINYTAQDEVLELRTSDSRANFDIRIGCSVTDASITGNVKTNVIAEPSVVIGFVGVQLVLDSDYNRQRTACFKALIELYNQNHDRLDKVPGRGDPINYDVIAQLPAYARIEQYRQAQGALILAQMAKVLLPPESAQSYASSLVNQIPVLSMLQQIDHGTDTEA
jgi:hypothetical protein